jgi:hypothetical protein
MRSMRADSGLENSTRLQDNIILMSFVLMAAHHSFGSHKSSSCFTVPTSNL